MSVTQRSSGRTRMTPISSGLSGSGVLVDLNIGDLATSFQLPASSLGSRFSLPDCRRQLNRSPVEPVEPSELWNLLNLWNLRNLRNFSNPTPCSGSRRPFQPP